MARIQEGLKYREGQTNERALLLRSLPITAVDLQRNLRSRIASLDKNLSDIESTINVLKARLARSGSSTAPSIHGIRESISKMTELALRKGREVDTIGNKIAELKAQRDGSAALYNPRHGITRDSIISELDFVNEYSRRQLKVSIADAIRNRPKTAVINKANIRHAKIN